MLDITCAQLAFILTASCSPSESQLTISLPQAFLYRAHNRSILAIDIHTPLSVLLICLTLIRYKGVKELLNIPG